MKPVYGVIASFNRLSTIKQTVASILATVAPSRLELTIVDDCSDKPTKDWLKELKLEHPGVNIYLFNEWVPGVAKTLNFGLSKKHPEQHFMAMDNDGVFQDEGWIDKLLYLMTKGVGVIAVKPPIIDFNNEYFPRHIEFPLELTSFLPNLCTMFHKEVIKEIGFYDDEFPWAGFDYNLATRAQKIGWVCGYYSSSRTNPEDYVDCIDLGRPQYYPARVPINYTEYKERYNQEVLDYIKDADARSLVMSGEKLHKIIYNGEGIIIEETCMSEFTNYEEL